MERIPQLETEIHSEHLEENAREIAEKFIRTAETYLEEGDPLRNRITSYYSRPETMNELLYVLSQKDESQISAYLNDVENFANDPVRFIEQMEKIYELQDVHQRRRAYASEDRLASDEEYQLGAYADILESQVRDAIFVLQRKGYTTFQSGFRERTERDQFMDFYDTNVVIPKEVLNEMNERSIEVSIEHFEDRTTLTLRPTGAVPVRLSEWKSIWDDFVSLMPDADGVSSHDVKQYGEHIDFRARQDLLRRQQ